MTDERKQAEEMIKERYGKDVYTNPPYYPTFAVEMQQMIESYASLKVAEATKEMYPISFVIWKDKHVHYDEEDNLYFVTTDDEKGIGAWLILEAVFEYWKQNIRK